MWIAAAGDDTVNGTYDGTRGGAGAARGTVKRALDDLRGLMGNNCVNDLGAKYTLDKKVGACGLQHGRYRMWGVQGG